MVVDVCDGDVVLVWINLIVVKYGKLDGVVNMVGIIIYVILVIDMIDNDWSCMFDVNVKGVFNCLRV